MNEGAEMKMTLDTPRQDMRVWRAPLIAVVLALLALVSFFWERVASMAAFWSRSESFTLGYLILPISLFLIWQRRRERSRYTPAPELRPVGLLPVLGRVWLLAHFASVLVIEQLAMVAMIPVVVWAILGWQITWALVFPLFFLFFAVPMGEELIPPLMDFTADFTVSMLQLPGIPVYREGTFFEIPSGHWSVVEGCSGVRYLIASVTRGCLYAYLTYRSPVRRVVFVILSFGVPIIANGLRAYMIVMIAHLSDMRLALGVDHFIYGWVFFGLVMLLLFWIGSYWREDDRPPEQPAIAMAEAAAPPPLRAASPWRAGVIVAALLLIWPALGYVHAAKESLVHASLNVPAVHDAWQTSAEEATRWRPHYLGTDAALRQSNTSGPRRVGVYLEYYRHQRQGAELINSQNYLVRQKDLEWRQVADAPRTITVRGKTVQIRQAKLRSAQQDLLVWYWYWMDGDYTTNHYLAKLWDAKAKLLGETGDAAAIILATPLGAEDQEAETVLADFVNAMEPAIRTSLDDAAHDCASGGGLDREGRSVRLRHRFRRGPRAASKPRARRTTAHRSRDLSPRGGRSRERPRESHQSHAAVPARHHLPYRLHRFSSAHPPRRGLAACAAQARRPRLLRAGFAPAGAVVIGTVGRLATVKDQITLVRAFITLLEREPQLRTRARLVIVGDGYLLTQALTLL